MTIHDTGASCACTYQVQLQATVQGSMQDQRDMLAAVVLASGPYGRQECRQWPRNIEFCPVRKFTFEIECACSALGGVTRLVNYLSGHKCTECTS